MATAIQKRVEALEVSHGGGGWGECGDCGGPWWGEPDDDGTYELIIDDEEYEEKTGEVSPDETTYCPGCGGIACFVLKFEDTGPERVRE